MDHLSLNLVAHTGIVIQCTREIDYTSIPYPSSRLKYTQLNNELSLSRYSSVVQIEHYFFENNGVICCISMRFYANVLLENTLYFIKKSVVEIEHLFRKKRRHLLYFNAILMPMLQHHRKARKLRFTCVFHEKKVFFKLTTLFEKNSVICFISMQF